MTTPTPININVNLPEMNATATLEAFPELQNLGQTDLAPVEGVINVNCTVDQASALFSINVTDSAAVDTDGVPNDIKYRCNNKDDSAALYYDTTTTPAAALQIPNVNWPTYLDANGDEVELKDVEFKHTTLGGMASGTASAPHIDDDAVIQQAMLYDIAEDYLGDANSLELINNEGALATDIGDRMAEVQSRVADNWLDPTMTSLDFNALAVVNPAREVLERMQEAGALGSDHMKVLIADLDARTADSQYVFLKFVVGDALNFNFTINKYAAVLSGLQFGANNPNLVGRDHVFRVKMTVVENIIVS